MDTFSGCRCRGRCSCIPRCPICNRPYQTCQPDDQQPEAEEQDQ